MINSKRLLGVGLVVGSVACGSSSSSSNPNSPSTTSTNHNPAITTLSVSPSFGVSSLNTFTFSGAATDADGDALTYTWTYGGATSTGTSVTATLAGDGSITVRLTVTDTKGGSATDTRAVTLGTMTGTWSVAFANCNGASTNPANPFTLVLTQTTAGVVTGPMTMPVAVCNASAGTTGQTDPADPGSITAAAAVRLRIKVGAFIDFTLTGTMDSTGRKVTGTTSGSGLDGVAFTMTKQ